MPSGDNRKKILILVGVIFVLIAIIGALFLLISVRKSKPQTIILPTPSSSKTYASSLGKIFPFDPIPFETGKKIGEVEVTLDDLEKKFILYYPDTKKTRIDSSNWEKIANMVTEDAILVNEGIKDGIYNKEIKTLTPNVVNKARDYYETEGTTYIDGEAIQLWFYNVEPPRVGTEAAKLKTKSIIEQLRTEILNNKLSMKQAAEKIRNMKDLEEIDKGYDTNAYIEFKYHKTFREKFVDTALDEELWKLEKGQISDILVGHDFGGDHWYDAYYIVIKINEKKLAEFNSVEDLIKTRKEQGARLIF